MIYIITLHYGTDLWIPIQGRHLIKYTDPSEYLVLCGTGRIPIQSLPDNYKQVRVDDLNLVNEHYIMMNYLYREHIFKKAKDDDIIVFMDGDAFPCNPWVPKITKYFEENDIVAVHRDEDLGYNQVGPRSFPHLTFFATKKKVWDECGFYWETFMPGQQPGSWFNDIIGKHDLRVVKLLRSNVFNKHEVMFGVYDDIIYHQSSGSRGIIGRPDDTIKGAPNYTRQCYEGRDLTLRQELGDWDKVEWEKEATDIIRVNVKVFDAVLDELQRDIPCNFVKRQFLGKP